jgi:hypothetical protein
VAVEAVLQSNILDKGIDSQSFEIIRPFCGLAERQPHEDDHIRGLEIHAM